MHGHNWPCMCQSLLLSIDAWSQLAVHVSITLLSIDAWSQTGITMESQIATIKQHNQYRIKETYLLLAIIAINIHLNNSDTLSKTEKLLNFNIG